MFALEIENLTKNYETQDLPAVYNLSLSLVKGEILALVGPSGCGKTTTLRMVAGFEHPDSGQLRIGGRRVAGGREFVPPERRGVGMVFQEHALFPHLTLLENVAFGLKGQPRAAKDKTASQMLALMGIEQLAARFPHEVSGGERQRAALARAMAPQPILLLLDEPFSSLDADLRYQLREEVRAILKTVGATAIFVTHDQEEAMLMGDRLAVLNRGRLEQLGSPEEIFHQPETRFVAEFMGQTDFLEGVVTRDGVSTEIGLLPQQLDLPEGSRVEVGVRADDVSFDPEIRGEGLVLARQFKGAMNIYRLRLGSGRIIHAYQPHTSIYSPGTSVQVRIDPGHPLACFAGDVAVKVLGEQPARQPIAEHR